MNLHGSRHLPLRRLAGALLVVVVGVILPAQAADAATGDPSVTFGLRPAGAQAVDQRNSWTYPAVKPGASFIDHLGVVNIADHPVTLKVYPGDAVNNATGAFDVRTLKEKSTDLGSWVQLTRSQVTVPAHSTVIMPFGITVPANAQPGDHAAGIVASFTSSTTDKKGNVISVDSRTGARIYLRVNGPLHPGFTVQELGVSYQPGTAGVGSGEAEVSYTVTNEGNVRLSGTPQVIIDPTFGGQSSARDLPQIPELLPGGSVTYHVKSVGLFPLGYDTARVTVTPHSASGNVDPDLSAASAQESFWAISWEIIVLILALIALAGYLVWRRLRRMRSAQLAHQQFADSDGEHEFEDAGYLSRVATTPSGSSGVSRPRRRRRRRIGLALGVLAAMVFGTVGLAAPASADDVGTLTFVPAKGVDINPIYSVTSEPCPAEATAVVAFISGGDFAPGTVAVSATSAGLRHDNFFAMPLSDSLQGLALSNNVKLRRGVYTITLECKARLGTKVFKKFSGAITFSDPVHYTAALPPNPPQLGIPLGTLGESYPVIQKVLDQAAAQEKAAAAKAVAPGAGAGAGAGGSPVPSAASSVGAVNAAAVPTSSASSSSPLSSDATGLIIGVGALLLLGLVGLRFFSSRDSRPGIQSEDDVIWPDDEDWSVEAEELDLAAPGLVAHSAPPPPDGGTAS